MRRNVFFIGLVSVFRLYATLIVFFIGCNPIAAKQENTKPNIVYILADDMGIGDVKLYNKNGKIPTPNIDRLGIEGMKFTDAHCNASVCTPTRYGILTGRYSWRTHLKKGVLKGMSPLLIEDERETVASLLKKQGYQTACIGKWHLGLDWTRDSTVKARKVYDVKAPIERGPLDVGFDYFFGMANSFNLSPHAFIEGRYVQGSLEYFSNREKLLERGINGSPGWAAKDFEQEEVLSIFTHKTCKWIQEHAEESFFVYMALNSPHFPVLPRNEFKGKSGLGGHGDFCMETDWAVGEVMNTIESLGLTDNTIVVFTSDNGISHLIGVKEMQEQGHYSSGIYRGLKGNVWEGGHRVPFLVRWPKKVKAGSVSDNLICTTDMLATCADLFHIVLPDNFGEDSYSMLPAMLESKNSSGNDRVVIHHTDLGYFGLRKGKWKLVLNEGGPSGRVNPKDKPIRNHDKHYMLFDLEKDVTESINVSEQFPEVVESMKKVLADIIQNGRSTPGKKQPTDVNNLDWHQIDLIRNLIR